MRSITLILFIFLLGIQSLWAGTTGKIAGYVRDQKTGEPLIGANVILEGLTIGASSRSDGYFYMINIPPGSYRVRAQFIGYTTLTKANVHVQVDRTTLVDFSMVGETLNLGVQITIEAEQPVVQKDLTSTMKSINAEEIKNLPVNSVNGVLQLQTGVVNSGGLHIRGGRSGEVAFYLDGHRVEDPLFNAEVLEINNQIIQQMELLTGTFNAEYGNALSGVVNIVTRKDFDRIRANVTYKRTRTSMETASDNLNERYWEWSLSGPLWKNSPVGLLFSGKKVDAENYYFSGNTRLYRDSTGKSINESIEFSRNKPFGYDDYLTLFGKIYYNPAPNKKLALYYNFSNRLWQNYDHVLRFIPDSSYQRTSGSHLIGFNFSHVLSEKLFYEIRFSYYQYNYLRNVAGLNFQDYSIPLFLTFSNSRFYRSAADGAYEDQKSVTYTGSAEATYQMNRYHLFKTGLDLKRHDFDYFYVNNPQNALARFENIYHLQPNEGAAYLQDKIEFETIILNLGLRFDFYHPRTRYPADPLNPAKMVSGKLKTAFSPRLGIAYPVTETSVFHFAYGEFFQRPAYEVLYSNINRIFGTEEPLFGMPNLEPEKTSSYELGLHTALKRELSVQVTFFSRKIENLVGIVWNYQPLPYAYYINEDFALVKGFEISGKWSRAFLRTQVNYTYSVAEGSSSSQQERYSGAFDVVGRQSLRFLPMDFDQRHTVNAELSLGFDKNEGPFGRLSGLFQNSDLSLLLRYGSGLPYTFNPERARYVPDRNNSRMPATLSCDLYAQKQFPVGDVRLSVFADIRNLLNRKNVRSVYSATGQPDYSASSLKGATPDYQQDPTNYFSPRTIYLGLSVDF